VCFPRPKIEVEVFAAVVVPGRRPINRRLLLRQTGDGLHQDDRADQKFCPEVMGPVHG
jgi:hypothetical protein